ncbi:hypothetical protein, partial [Tabrizicola caldifontis]|uniref:hypothetical protein n=1 Tax=Tabrizicola caldifontis TaxID=2528036 RepID=UPI00197E1C32
QDRPPHPSVALTRPRRLTTVAAEPQILPLNPMPAQTLPETGTAAQPMIVAGDIAAADLDLLHLIEPDEPQAEPTVVVPRRITLLR